LINDDLFICEKYFKDWGQVHTEPVRIATELLVHTDTFLVSFNMARPIKVKAAVNLLNSFFTIVVMVVFGFALSTVVTELAVTPLERMLGTVREMASTVFRFSSDIGQEEDVQETTDIDNAGEMILLEKVVEKLAAIASVQANSEPIQTEGMDNEDIGVLNMLTGNRGRGGHRKTVKSKEEKEEVDRASETKRTPQRSFRPTPTLRLQVNGVDEETYNSSAFDVFQLSSSQLANLAFHIMVSAKSGTAVLTGEKDEENLIRRFCTEVQTAYQPSNPFHNFGHAVDVLAQTVRILNLIEADTFLSALEQFSLLIAALGHDMGHPGKNNVFLSEVGHELAIKYNDISPLENMHCALLYQTLVKPETALLKSLSHDDYKEVRKVIVESILHTDMIGHPHMVKVLSLMYQINSEVFRGSSPGGRVSRKTTFAVVSAEPAEVFRKPENKNLSINTILHSADVSNPARDWRVTKKWADCCLEEFFAQGDQEKALGIPMQFLNDREKLNRPNSQIGFIEFMIAPFFAAQIWLWPALYEFGEHLSTNISTWEEAWLAETMPTEEESEKVHARVTKVKETLSYAALRIAS